jgi:hypothetical protein
MSVALEGFENEKEFFGKHGHCLLKMACLLVTPGVL